MPRWFCSEASQQAGQDTMAPEPEAPVVHPQITLVSLTLAVSRRLCFCHHPTKRSCGIVEFVFTCFGLAPAHKDGNLSLTCLPKAHPCTAVPELANEGSVPCALWRWTESSGQHWKVETIIIHSLHVGQLRSLSEVTYHILMELTWYAHHGSRGY